MVLDVLLIACIALFVVVGMIRGGVKTLCSLIATALAFILSMFSAAWLAAKIYDPYISQRIIETVANEITSESSQTLNNITSVLPDFVNSIIQANGININEIASGAAAQSAEFAAQTVEAAVAPYIVSLLTIVLVVVLFILFRIAFSLIINLIDKVFRLPVLNQLNRLLGLVCGFMQGIIVALFIVSVIQSSFSSGMAQPPMVLTEDYINSSFIFKYFYSGKILDSIIELVK